MPKAVVSLSGSQRFDLKSLPANTETGEEGGFVTLRRMTYGQKLERMDMATQSTIKAQQQKKKSRDIDAEMSIKMLNRVVTEYEFRTCIVDHNLQNEAGDLLNFHQAQSIDFLDPRVGDEISKYIGEMNNFEEDEDDFLKS